MERAKREMSFDEEFVYLKEEFEKVIESEDPHGEPKFVNCVLRRAMRCIRKQGEELQAYKDLEEQERLLVLPCPIGSTIYHLKYPTRVDADGVEWTVLDRKRRTVEPMKFALCHLKHIGDWYFLTKAEAEKALEEMEK